MKTIKIITVTLIFVLLIYFIEYTHANKYIDINSPELSSIRINEQEKCTGCSDTTILVVLKDEPALIHRGCSFESDLFYVELIKEPEINHYVSKWIYPCTVIPIKFQIEGLSVLVSGNILSCGKYNPCFPSKPNVRIVPANFFQIKRIRILQNEKDTH